MKRIVRVLGVTIVLLWGCSDENDPAGPDLSPGEPLNNIVATEVSGSFGFLPPVGKSGQSINPPVDAALLEVLIVEICRISTNTDPATLLTLACGDVVGTLTDDVSFAGNFLTWSDPTVPQYDAPVDFSAPEIMDDDLLLIRVGIADPDAPATFRTLGAVPVAFSRQVQSAAEANGIIATRESKNRTWPLKFVAGLGVTTASFCAQDLSQDPEFDQGETCVSNVLTRDNRVAFFPDAANPIAAVQLPVELFDLLGVDGIVLTIDDLPNPPCLPIPNAQADACLNIASTPAFDDDIWDGLNGGGAAAPGQQAEEEPELIKIQACIDQDVTGTDLESYRYWRVTDEGAEALEPDPDNTQFFSSTECAGYGQMALNGLLGEGRVARLASRLLGPVVDFIAPKPLFAAHATLTSISTGFSPFGYAEELWVNLPGAIPAAVAPGAVPAGTTVSLGLMVYQVDHQGDPVRDGNGNLVPAPGIPVLFTVTEGGGMVREAGGVFMTSVSIVSNANGIATVTWKVGDAGIQRMEAQVDGDFADFPVVTFGTTVD